MNAYKVSLRRSTRWDVYPQTEAACEVIVHAINEHYAIMAACELPRWRVSPPEILSCILVGSK